MPSNDKNITEEQQNKVKASQALTLLLGEDGKLYYYEGEPDYKNYDSLKETTYEASGLRKLLLSKTTKQSRKYVSLRIRKQGLKSPKRNVRRKLPA